MIKPDEETNKTLKASNIAAVKQIKFDLFKFEITNN